MNTILDDAARLTSQERNEDYGPPEKDFKCVTEMFNIYIRHKYEMRRLASEPVQIKLLSSEDHAIYMILTKISRHAYKPKRDNCVDIAGYARTLAIVGGFDEIEYETPSHILSEAAASLKGN